MNLSIKNTDDYLALQPEKFVVLLEKIRQAVRTLVPEAVEVMSYGMPAFKYKGRMLIYYAGFKNHCSLFPGGKAVVSKFKKELKPYKTSAGTISFTAERPLPAALLKKIISARAKDNLNKSKLKAKSTTKK